MNPLQFRPVFLSVRRALPRHFTISERSMQQHSRIGIISIRSLQIKRFSLENLCFTGGFDKIKIITVIYYYIKIIKSVPTEYALVLEKRLPIFEL